MPIWEINSVLEMPRCRERCVNYPIILSHLRSSTVSFENYPLYSLINELHDLHCNV